MARSPEEIMADIQQLKQMSAQRGGNRQSRRMVVLPKIKGMEIFDPEMEMSKKLLEKEASMQYPSATERTKIQEQDMLSDRIKGMMNIFDKAYPASRTKTFVGSKLKSIPMIGNSAMYDRLIGAELSGKIPLPFSKEEIPIGRLQTGSYPRADEDWNSMAAYEDMSGGLLTTLAKRAGEQRPTDEDVKRFRPSLPGFGKDPGTNRILKEALLQDAEALSPQELYAKYTGRVSNLPMRKR